MRARHDDGGPSDDQCPMPSELEEGVLGLLEDAGVPQDVCDRIAKEINAWEASQIEPEPDYVPPPDEPEPENEAFTNFENTF